MNKKDFHTSKKPIPLNLVNTNNIIINISSSTTIQESKQPGI